MFVEINEISLVTVVLDEILPPTPKTLPADSASSDAITTTIPRQLLQALIFLISEYETVVVTARERDEIANILIECRFDKPVHIRQGSSELPDHQSKLQDAMARAIEANAAMPHETVCLCCGPSALSAARNQRTGTIYWRSSTAIPENERKCLLAGPDFVVDDVPALIEVFRGCHVTYYGERLALGSQQGPAPDAPARPLKLPLDKDFPGGSSVVVHVSGRYFVHDDPRAKKHALTSRLLNAKSCIDRHSLLFAKILSAIIEMAKREIDYITRVPPRPGKKDRLGEIIARLDFADAVGGNLVARPDILHCATDYDPQKSAGNYQSRYENVKGKFSVSENIQGRTIAVFDDVVTSGATLAELRRVLLDAGAADVLLSALSFTVKKLEAPAEDVECAECGGTMLLRHRKRDGELFWGCENYFQQSKCTNTLQFHTGVYQLNQGTQPVTNPFDEVEWIDIFETKH